MEQAVKVAEEEFDDMRGAKQRFCDEPASKDYVLALQMWQSDNPDVEWDWLSETLADVCSLSVLDLPEMSPATIGFLPEGARKIVSRSMENQPWITGVICQRQDARLLISGIHSGETKYRCQTFQVTQPDIIFDLFNDLGAGVFADPHHQQTIRIEDLQEEEEPNRIAIQPGETPAAFMRRLHTATETLKDHRARFAVFGFGLDVMELAIRQQKPTVAPSLQFLVPGVIPKGVVTLLGARRKTGKSTILTELAHVVGSGGGKWCGFDVPTAACGGLVLLFSGEDALGTIHHRLDRMGAGSPMTVPFGNDTTDLKEQLDLFLGSDVSLVIVDPSRKYYSGDEDSSDGPNALFNILNGFAAKKSCAIIMAHHPTKNPTTNSLEDVAASMRGSGVFLDRPRVILCMLRQKEETILGIPFDSGTTNPLHNYPAEMMFSGRRRLRRDPQTHRHLPIDDHKPMESSSEDCGAVLRALASLAAANVRVTKTGNYGLFEQWPTDHPKLSRQAVRAACELLIASGALGVIDGALEVLPDQANGNI